MLTLEILLAELESAIAQQQAMNAAVSKANVGWHIEHSLLTIDVVIKALKKSDPQHYTPRFSMPRLIVFTTNAIPRGKAKSPKAVVPDAYTAQSLREHVNLTKSNIEELAAIDKNKYFNHPFFGHIRAAKTRKFLVIHTSHHVKIIRDILR